MNEKLLAVAEVIIGKAFVRMIDRMWNDGDKALAEWILALVVRQSVVLITARTEKQRDRCVKNLKHIEAIVVSRLARAHIEAADEINAAIAAAVKSLTKT